ncbi:MAG: MarR family transcriptional regulator [Spirochaetes bacterium]|nr:MarR family transcriptional regulator [Spirochaetota bacterium]
MEIKLVDLIIELKRKCKIEDEIGKAYNLTLREVHAVLVLSNKGDLTLNKLSEAMELSPSRTSRIVTSLVKKEMITSNQNPQDRRNISLSLTKKGKDCTKVVEEEKIKCEKKFAERLTEQQMINVKKSMKQLVKVL